MKKILAFVVVSTLLTLAVVALAETEPHAAAAAAHQE
jgi:hypothetical protein